VSAKYDLWHSVFNPEEREISFTPRMDIEKLERHIPRMISLIKNASRSTQYMQVNKTKLKLETFV
jgi:hypothetical protein